MATNSNDFDRERFTLGGTVTDGGTETPRDHVANALQIALCAKYMPDQTLDPVDVLAIIGRLRRALAQLDGDA